MSSSLLRSELILRYLPLGHFAIMIQAVPVRSLLSCIGQEGDCCMLSAMLVASFRIHLGDEG